MIDTELVVGTKFTWLFTPPGGYGYTIPVDAILLQVRERKDKMMAKIRVTKKDGTTTTRWVKASNLRPMCRK